MTSLVLDRAPIVRVRSKTVLRSFSACVPGGYASLNQASAPPARAVGFLSVHQVVPVTLLAVRRQVRRRPRTRATCTRRQPPSGISGRRGRPPGRSSCCCRTCPRTPDVDLERHAVNQLVVGRHVFFRDAVQVFAALTHPLTTPQFDSEAALLHLVREAVHRFASLPRVRLTGWPGDYGIVNGTSEMFVERARPRGAGVVDLVEMAVFAGKSASLPVPPTGRESCNGI